MILADLLPTAQAFARMLLRAKAHMVVLDANCRAPRVWLEAAHHAQVPCVLIGDPSGQEPWLDLIDHEFGRSRDSLDLLPDTVEAELIRPHRQGKERRPLERLGRWLVLQSPLAPWFAQRFVEVPDLATLRAELGVPETILALGNGPSSEADNVRASRYDALFRVNHGWIDRGVHQRADVVFTGLRDTVMRHPRDAVFVFQTREDAEDMRFKCASRRGPIRYACADRLGSIDPAGFGIHRPTNGAVMIATAVALQPPRLLVGGIDLFSHPEGTYPGDARTPNAYTLAHDRNTELAFILQSLAGYRGELTILNDILAAEWNRYRARLNTRPAESVTDSEIPSS
ncbi:MAG: hypothetical protein U5R48_08485 [Gammaproteobacteria bacterium]|nr:hypothetical protein [Gammaproteobacteria bacterium]